MYDKYMQTGVLPKKISNNKVLTKSENESNYLTQQALDELVSDDFINSITNDYNEVVIDGILYNITPYGTFYIEEYSRLILNALVDEITLANPVESLDLDNVQIDLSMYDTYYDEETEVLHFSNGVSYIRTFSYDEIIDFNTNTTPIANYASSIDNDPIFQDQNMKPATISNQNGSLLTTIFVNSTDYNYFDTQYRTSVLFYNRNYGLIKTIGVKVKQQKKGLFWWNKIAADEIVAGWKYLVYNSSIKIPKPSIPKTVYSVKTGSVVNILLPLEENDFNNYISQYDNAAYEHIFKDFWTRLRGFAIQSGPNVGKISVTNSDGTVSLMTSDEILAMNRGNIIYNWNGVDTEGNVKFILAPRFVRKSNESIIDIPLDFEIYISSSPITVIKTIFSSIKIESAQVFGSTRRGSTWKGILIK